VAQAAINCWTFASGPAGALGREGDGETSVPLPVNRRPHIGQANTSASPVGTSGVWQRAHSRRAWSFGTPRGVALGAGGTIVGRYAAARAGGGDTVLGTAVGSDRAGPRAAERAQLGPGPPVGWGGGGRAGGEVGTPQRIVPVRASLTRPAGPRRESSRSTFSVRGMDQESAAARPGTDVVPSDVRVAIACCRSSGVGRDQKGSRTNRGGPARGRKTIVREEPGQKWAPAKRLSVSWTVPPRDAFRRYPRPGYVHLERLYSYRAPRRMTWRGFPGPPVR